MSEQSSIPDGIPANAWVSIHSAEDVRLEPYRDLTDGQLMRQRGLFVAEGRLIVELLLSGEARYQLRSVLVNKRAHDAMRDVLDRACDAGQCEVCVAEQGVMDELAGFPVHRGCMGLGVRKNAHSGGAGGELGLPQLLGAIGDGDEASARTVVALEDTSNHDNMGGVFRSAAALGARGILLSPACCDPLYRKAIRVSMGHALRVPWGRSAEDSWPSDLERLRGAGYTVVALDGGAEAMPLGNVARELRGRGCARIVLLAGAEGPGLSKQALAHADYKARIPMAEGVDSLNLTVAVSIALDRLRG